MLSRLGLLCFGYLPSKDRFDERLTIYVTMAIGSEDALKSRKARRFSFKKPQLFVLHIDGALEVGYTFGGHFSTSYNIVFDRLYDFGKLELSGPTTKSRWHFGLGSKVLATDFCKLTRAIVGITVVAVAREDRGIVTTVDGSHLLGDFVGLLRHRAREERNVFRLAIDEVSAIVGYFRGVFRIG